VAENGRKTKKARVEQREKHGWVDTDPNSYKWVAKTIDKPTAGARLAKIKRTATITDVFFVLFPPSVLVEVRKEVGKEQLYYGGKKVPIVDIYKMYAVNLYLRAAAPHLDKGTHHNVFNEVYKVAINHFDNTGCLGVRKMLSLRSKFKISPTVARDKLSKAFRKATYLGQFVCMDEKQKKWRGRSPCIKKVLAKKNDPIGHWTTQVCVNLSSTSVPFIIGLYPLAGKLKNGAPLETRSEIWTWLVQLLEHQEKPKAMPVICADSYYLDNSARNMLIDKNVLYHCSVKKNWFLPVTKHLEAQVKEMGKWSAMENKNTGELAVLTWSSEKDIGKKFLLSNLLEKKTGKQQADNPPGWDAYKLMFNGCDKYNIQISKFMWPYRLSHWTAHFDDIFQVHIALNTVAIWRELHPDEDCGTTKSLLIKLATELHKCCTSNNVPASQW
jgi:hypothetical protein